MSGIREFAVECDTGVEIRCHHVKEAVPEQHIEHRTRHGGRRYLYVDPRACESGVTAHLEMCTGICRGDYLRFIDNDFSFDLTISVDVTDEHILDEDKPKGMRYVDRNNVIIYSLIFFLLSNNTNIQ